MWHALEEDTMRTNTENSSSRLPRLTEVAGNVRALTIAVASVSTDRVP